MVSPASQHLITFSELLLPLLGQSLLVLVLRRLLVPIQIVARFTAISPTCNNIVAAVLQRRNILVTNAHSHMGQLVNFVPMRREYIHSRSVKIARPRTYHRDSLWHLYVRTIILEGSRYLFSTNDSYSCSGIEDYQKGCRLDLLWLVCFRVRFFRVLLWRH